MLLAFGIRRSAGGFCIPFVHSAMKKRFGEEEIKAQLRDLTEKTRHIREELAALVHHHASVPPREYPQAPAPQPPLPRKRRRKR